MAGMRRSDGLIPEARSAAAGSDPCAEGRSSPRRRSIYSRDRKEVSGMNDYTRETAAPHRLSLDNRAKLTLTGVCLLYTSRCV